MTTFSAITIPETRELIESLTMIGTGFVVVMSVLCFLWLSITITGKLFVARQKRTKEKNDSLAVPGAQASPAEQPDQDISATTLALIAAAVQTTVTGPYRILGVERRHSSHEPQTQVSNWSVEGRRSIFSSHQVR